MRNRGCSFHTENASRVAIPRFRGAQLASSIRRQQRVTLEPKTLQPVHPYTTPGGKVLLNRKGKNRNRSSPTLHLTAFGFGVACQTRAWRSDPIRLLGHSTSPSYTEHCHKGHLASEEEPLRPRSRESRRRSATGEAKGLQ